MAEPDTIWVSNPLGFRVPNTNHPWVARGDAPSPIGQSIDVPVTWQQGDRVALYGFSGFDSD